MSMHRPGNVDRAAIFIDESRLIIQDSSVQSDVSDMGKILGPKFVILEAGIKPLATVANGYSRCLLTFGN